MWKLFKSGSTALASFKWSQWGPYSGAFTGQDVSSVVAEPFYGKEQIHHPFPYKCCSYFSSGFVKGDEFCGTFRKLNCMCFRAQSRGRTGNVHPEKQIKCQTGVLCIVFRPGQWWSHPPPFKAILFTCPPRTTPFLTSWRAMVRCAGKVNSLFWSFSYVDSAKCPAFPPVEAGMGGKPEGGICLTVTCKFSAWILLGVNPAIMVLVLFFLCLFLDKTSYWRWIVDAEKIVKWLWLLTPRANSICLAGFSF